MPVIHITDLYNPPGDPDDHFDLVSLLAVPDLSVAGVVIDQTVERGVPGMATVGKAAALCRRDEVPCEVGLERPLQNEWDAGTEQSIGCQQAVEMILRELGRCRDQAMIFTVVGSLRDLAAAFNREPELFHAKTKRLLINAGDSCGEVGPRDWNTSLDVQAWRRIMGSPLPIDWYPCNPSKGRGKANRHTTWWGFSQNTFLQSTPEVVRRFFDSEGISSDSADRRHMWSTASLRDAARMEGCQGVTAGQSYELMPIALDVAEEGTARWRLVNSTEVTNARIFAFRSLEGYESEMNDYLMELFASIRE